MTFTDRQIKALTWGLDVLIEQTAGNVHDYEAEQAVDEVCDLASLVELMPAGETRDRLANFCESLRREHQVRLDQVLAAEAAAAPKVGVTFEIDGHGDGEEFPDLTAAGTRIAEWVANLDLSQGAVDYRINIEALEPAP